MRFLLLAVLAACSTDTFDTGDGGDAAATNDAISGGDGIAPGEGGGKADAAPFDPSQLGASLALWLDAADAKTGTDGSDAVSAWPDHLHKYTTQISTGSSTQICSPGLHSNKAAALNNKPVVTFCGTMLLVNDDAGPQLAAKPFYIAAVLAPPGPGLDEVIFTKTPPGQSQAVPSGLTALVPNSSGHMQGWLNSTTSAFSQSSLPQEYQYVAFVRTSTDQIYVRVSGGASPAVSINSTDDVSASGAPVGIGGYAFDLQGQVHNVFTGALAELLVVAGPDTVGLVETYFKKKYNL